MKELERSLGRGGLELYSCAWASESRDTVSAAKDLRIFVKALYICRIYNRNEGEACCVYM